MLAPCFRFGLWRWRYFAKLFGVVWFHGFCCCFCCRIRHLWKSCWSRHRVMFEGSERPRAGSSTCNHSLMLQPTELADARSKISLPRCFGSLHVNFLLCRRPRSIPGKVLMSRHSFTLLHFSVAWFLTMQYAMMSA